MESDPEAPSFDLQRQQLVAALRGKGIRNEAVLAAMATVPRHLFVPVEIREQSYEDRALPISSGQTISQPYTVAVQLELLDLVSETTVLEIGTGSGYCAAVLAAMGARVYTIERIGALYRRIPLPGLESFFPGVTFLHGDGHSGFTAAAPYDRVLLTAASASVPAALLRQLKTGGCLVLPLGPYGKAQRMTRIWKTEKGLKEEDFGAFEFVPLLPGLA